MMQAIRLSNAAVFKERVTPFLLQNEAVNNIIFGILHSIQTGAYGEPHTNYMAYVERNDEIVGVALRTPPHGVLLSTITDDNAIPCLIASLSQFYASLPTVIGQDKDATLFAEHWQQPHQLKMQQGAYQLTQVIMPENVSGEFRQPAPNDRELIIDWQMAMSQEALGDSRDRDTVAEVVDRRLASDNTDENYGLWWDDNNPVSMAAFTGPTPNGMRINCVYTPPKYRKNGYASAVTAAISQQVLDSGRQFCFLFTDMSNPTANHIYQMIGYEQISTQYLYEFEEQ